MQDEAQRRRLFHDLRGKVFVVQSFFEVADRYSSNPYEIDELRKSAACCLKEAKMIIEEIAKVSKTESIDDGVE